MDLEKLSVGAVESRIAVCPHLKSLIDTNDKTPFIDGHIHVYREPSKKNADHEGRVSVQVKGRSAKNLESPTVARSITRDDLNAFLRESGVLYFVVSVNDSGRCAVYYLNLTPFMIDDLLGRMKAKQKSTTVSLKRLPEEPRAIEAIVRFALTTRGQTALAGMDPLLLEHAESFVLRSPNKLDLEEPIKINFATGDASMVLRTTGGMEVHLDGEVELTPQEYVRHRAPFTVSSGSALFDEVDRQKVDRYTTKLYLGPGVELSVTRSAERHALNASITPAGTLKERLQAIDFMIALSETGSMSINKRLLEFGSSEEDERLPEMRGVRQSLWSMAELFEHLEVDSDLVDMRAISDNEVNLLVKLRDALVGSQEVTLKSLNAGLVLQRFAGWRLIFLAVNGSTPSHWRLTDIFSPDFRRQFLMSGEEGSISYPATAYDTIEAEQLTSTLNLRLGAVVGAYQAIADRPDTTFALATNFVVALIKASDASAERRQEFIEGAIALTEWLLEADGAKPHHLVNRWQLLHRQGLLTPAQRGEIRALKHGMAHGNEEEQSHLIEIACALLLDDPEDADYLSAQVSDEDLQRMREWPIWALRAP